MAKKEWTKEEMIEELDRLIQRDAEIWKDYIRKSDAGLYDFWSRRDSALIIKPSQR